MPAQPKFKSVDEYIAAQPDDSQRVLKRVRSIIRKALPEALETISYNMPTYKVNGKAAIFFAGWSEHYSLYPVNRRVREAFKDQLTQYELEKGTVRFPLSDPVPAMLIERIAKFRARECAR